MKNIFSSARRTARKADGQLLTSELSVICYLIYPTERKTGHCDIGPYDFPNADIVAVHNAARTISEDLSRRGISTTAPGFRIFNQRVNNRRPSFQTCANKLGQIYDQQPVGLLTHSSESYVDRIGSVRYLSEQSSRDIRSLMEAGLNAAIIVAGSTLISSVTTMPEYKFITKGGVFPVVLRSKNRFERCSVTPLD